MLLPRLRSPTPSHCGELLILLGRPQRNVTAFLSLLVLCFFCCTPSAKRNSMSKPIRVCPLLWTALGTNMVAKQLFSIEIKLPTSWDTWKRWPILQGGTECPEVGKRWGKWSLITLQIKIQSPPGNKGTFKTRRSSRENRTEHLYLKHFQLEKKRPQPQVFKY